MEPAPERYKEIQEALADKGYFHGPVDGTWGADSTDAMKRFQTEQNLSADGKISALSLIALGLGPRRVNGLKAVSGDSSEPAAGTEAPETPAPVVPAPGGGANSNSVP
jgi:peptidoglycan hydrolase-like protein with peptidoglycan-binding domain